MGAKTKIALCDVAGEYAVRIRESGGVLLEHCLIIDAVKGWHFQFRVNGAKQPGLEQAMDEFNRQVEMRVQELRRGQVSLSSLWMGLS